LDADLAGAFDRIDHSYLLRQLGTFPARDLSPNREPDECLTMMSDALLAQSAVDRLTAGAHTLIIEGPSYRRRNRPNQHAGIDSESEAHNAQ
jgi:hypothetical protein